MENRADKAVEIFRKGFNCSQAVLSAWASGIGLDPEVALKVSSGFGGGMGRLQGVCGAVTGAFMAIGYRHGMLREGDTGAKEKAYALVQRFAREFTSLHGTSDCGELLGCDLNTPEGQREYKEKGFFEAKCVAYVRDAARMLESCL